MSAESTETAPRDYSRAAHLLTLFACVPFGLAAQSASRQVEIRWAEGDRAGALQASGLTLRYCYFAAAAGVFAWGLALVWLMLSLQMGADQP